MRGQLLAVVKLLYKQSEVWVHVNGMKKCQCWIITRLCSFSSPVHYTHLQDKQDRDSSSNSSITFG